MMYSQVWLSLLEKKDSVSEKRRDNKTGFCVKANEFTNVAGKSTRKYRKI